MDIALFYGKVVDIHSPLAQIRELGLGKAFSSLTVTSTVAHDCTSFPIGLTLLTVVELFSSQVIMLKLYGSSLVAHIHTTVVSGTFLLRFLLGPTLITL